MKKIDIEKLQQRRFETYEMEKDQLIVVKAEKGYTVSNIKKASTYIVDKDFDTGLIYCNCKDFNNYKEYHLKCKHIIAVMKKASRVSKPAINTETKKEENIMSNNQDNNNQVISNKSMESLMDILSIPFTQEQIKYRPGRNNAQLAYIETWSVIERLNKAFSHKWDFNILSSQVDTANKNCYVLGKLTVTIDDTTVTKEAFGGQILNSTNIGDELKGAASDSLKKCASLLGVGLHLYKPQVPQRHPVTAFTTTPATATKQNTTTPNAPTVPTQKSTVERPVSTTQTVGSVPEKSGGGNGKGGGNGSGDINRIIERW